MIQTGLYCLLDLRSFAALLIGLRNMRRPGGTKFQDCSYLFRRGLPACREASSACQPDPNRDISPKNLWRKEEEENGTKRKEYAFQHQFNGKPSIILGCPGEGGGILPEHNNLATLTRKMH